MALVRRSISIFGSTGSIGVNTLDVIRSLGKENFDIKVLSGSSNIDLLSEQAKEFNADYAITANSDLEAELSAKLSGSNTKVASGADNLVKMATTKVDWAMSAIVGAAGLSPTIEMAKNAKTLALANKETMVCAGELLQKTCADHECTLLPVDSEHSAIFQALKGESIENVSRIILTASGGPFLNHSVEDLSNVTLEQALNHPNWDMGQRITIDSASMFNKALEVIEAKYLFCVSSNKIDVIIHPQSIIHSMVEFKDNAVIAQMGTPDMRGPIGYALQYPKRDSLPCEQLNFAKLSQLSFQKPDTNKFPALRLANMVMNWGGLSGAVLNAAKEIALDRFIEGDIKFTDMAKLVESALLELKNESTALTSLSGLDSVLKIDKKARTIASKWNAS